MLEIIICDDDLVQRRKLEKFIANYIKYEGLSMRIALSTDNPYDVINFVREEEKIRVYFLDVELEAQVNGFELGAEIRKHDPHGFVIYVTAHPELAGLNFVHQVGAIDYIIKEEVNVMEEKIIECLHTTYKRYGSQTKEKKIFRIPLDGSTLFIEHKDILFFATDSYNRKVVLYTKNNKRINFWGALKDIENLDEDFCRCHKSFIVNKKHVIKLVKEEDENRVYMSNGDYCLVSRNGMRILKKHFE